MTLFYIAYEAYIALFIFYLQSFFDYTNEYVCNLRLYYVYRNNEVQYNVTDLLANAEMLVYKDLISSDVSST